MKEMKVRRRAQPPNLGMGTYPIRVHRVIFIHAEAEVPFGRVSWVDKPFAPLHG